MMSDDFEGRMIDDLVRGLSYRETAQKHGVSVERVVEAHDRAAARMLAPENIQAMLIQSLDTLKTVESVFAATLPGPMARRIVRQARRQQARTGKLILQRAPRTSRPV